MPVGTPDLGSRDTEPELCEMHTGARSALAPGELREDAKNRRHSAPAPPPLVAPEDHSAKTRRTKALTTEDFRKVPKGSGNPQFSKRWSKSQ